MYLQKRVQCNSGEYVGADEDGSLYKDVIVLMEQGLQKSSVFVIKACPEVKVEGHGLQTKFQHLQGGPIKCYHFSIIHKFSNVNLFKIFIQRCVVRNIKPTFNINEFVKSELCREEIKICVQYASESGP